MGGQIPDRWAGRYQIGGQLHYRYQFDGQVPVPRWTSARTVDPYRWEGTRYPYRWAGSHIGGQARGPVGRQIVKRTGGWEGWWAGR